MTTPQHDDDLMSRIDDPFVRGAVRTSVHIRRYLPFYVFSLIWALMLAVFPTVRGLGDDAADLATAGGGFDSSGVAIDDGSTGSVDGTSPDTVAVSGGGATAAPGASGGQQARGGRTTQAPGAKAAPGGGGPAPVSVADSLAAAHDMSGVARSGLECKPGVRQIPVSAYAAGCTKKFEGNNGGATYRGVHPDKIVIVRRVFPESANSRAADQINQQAGLASDDVAAAVRETFIKWFNDNYELYGRKVEFIEWESANGNSTEEAQSRGREGACADATYIQKELKAFGVVGGSQPFSECAAERGLVVFRGAAYFPESFYKKYHPFVWHTTMECERISYQVAEYIGKRLNGRKAKWAGDPLYRNQNRKFGTYVPDNDGYQRCVDITQKTVKEQYGADPGPRYNYQLDLSRFPDQAAQAAVQFKAQGITTLVLACDPYSVLFLTQAAARQEWRPEWFLIGVAATDTDTAARLYDQSEVDGHLFGMSQLGSTDLLLGKNSEPGRMYKHITGKDIPDGTTGSYFDYVQVFNFLQAAGPVLTPQTMADGVRKIIPGGAPDFAAGYWSWADGPDGRAGAGDHTGIDDSREIFWDGQATAPDGKKGTFIETMGGKRFRNGQWPEGEPPVYPGK